MAVVVEIVAPPVAALVDTFAVALAVFVLVVIVLVVIALVAIALAVIAVDPPLPR